MQMRSYVSMSALSTAFDYIYDHKTGIILASNTELALFRDHVEEIFAPRAATIGLEETPYADYVLDHLRPVTKDQVEGIEPLTDITHG